MAAVFDAQSPISPISYTASQSALVLLDFQKFIVGLCEDKGKVATENAAKLREWALSRNILVIHSIVDINGKPTPVTKGLERLQGMLQGIRQDQPQAAEEDPTLAPKNKDLEHVVLKSPGIVSGLKSSDAVDLLAKKGIKHLIICGLSTSGAVLRTTVPATDDGFVVSVVSDACADPKEDIHKMLIETVLPSRAHVMDVATLISEWEKAGTV